MIFLPCAALRNIDGKQESHSSMKKAAPVQQYLRLVADSLLFVLLAHKGDTNPGRSI